MKTYIRFVNPSLKFAVTFSPLFKLQVSADIYILYRQTDRQTDVHSTSPSRLFVFLLFYS